jgi:Xaa-Pro aminopeptidase
VDKLIIAPGTDPDQFYATGLQLHTFITLVRGKKQYLAAGGFEYPQAAAVQPTIRFETLGKDMPSIIKAFLQKYNVKKPLMPSTTAAVYARLVPGAQFTSEVFPQRAVKTAAELREIRAVQKATEAAITAVRDVLAASTVKEKKAHYKGKPLTSEHLKRVAAIKLAEYNCSCPDMIISSGKQTALPHHRGSGVIREGSVIVDIFPQSHESRYFADCTRTFVIGKTPKHFDERFDAIAAVQQAAQQLLTHGAHNVDGMTRSVFTDLGFATDGRAGTGYIHGLGHGVGLEIHENPRLSGKVVEGNVVTVEPGLYYDYGIRLENIGVVKKNGFTNFTKLDTNPYL